MAFTEFYCNSSGSNVNAGSATTVIGGANNAAAYSAANGAWDKDNSANVGRFTPASGDPSATVSVGDFASIYADAATVPGFVGRVVAVTSTYIDISQTAISGTVPADAANGISCKVGGAWAGPAAGVGFPFGFAAATMTNAGGDTPRINFNGTFTISTGITHNIAGPCRFQGYTSSAGDGGKFTLDASTNAILPLAMSGANTELVDAVATCSATTGTNACISLGAANCLFHRVVTHGARGDGVTGSSSGIFVECESYDNNKANGSSAGFQINTAGCVYDRCIAHDNSGSTGCGFATNSAATYLGCISDSNGSHGWNFNALTCGLFAGCDAYNNGGDGIRIGRAGTLTFVAENCNFVKNGGYGINNSGTSLRMGLVTNCGFGSGTQVNVSGQTNNLDMIVISGSVVYADDVTPWVDPANGDFRVNLATAIGAGRGAFTQTAASYAGTVSYPSIGASEPQVTLPAAGDVRLSGSNQYGYAGALYDGTISMPNSGTPTGTEDATSDACVVSGKNYGAGNARTGSGAGGGYTYGDESAAQVLTTATGAGTYQPVAAADVQAGVAVGVSPAVGTFDVPTEAQVQAGVTFGDAAEFTGTYDPMAAAVFPAEANTSTAETAYGPTGAEYAGSLNLSLYTLISGVVAAGDVRLGTARYSGGSTGTCYVPAAGDVQFGVNVDATTGTFTSPPAAKVIDDTSWGAGGTEFTGTYATPVQAGYSALAPGYGAGGLTTGTLAAASIHDATYGTLADGSVLVAAGGTYVDPIDGEVKLGTAIGVSPRAGTWDAVSKTDVVAATWVVTGNSNYAGGDAGTYPTTATSQAAQLAADIAAVTAGQAGMTTTTTILTVTGTLDLSLYTLISGVAAAVDVQSGVARYTGGSTGTLTLPAIGDVESGVQFGGGGTEFTGTFAVPTEAQVEDGVGFGSGGTEFTGTLASGNAAAQYAADVAVVTASAGWIVRGHTILTVAGTFGTAASGVSGAIWYNCCTAIQTLVQALGLDGVANANVLVHRVPLTREVQKPSGVGFPAIIIAPSDRIEQRTGTNASDDVGYGVSVSLARADNFKVADDANLDKHAKQLEDIAKIFRNKRLTTVSQNIYCRIESGSAAEFPAWLKQLLAGTITVRCVCRAGRT